jgi:hypothetical protein
MSSVETLEFGTLVYWFSLGLDGDGRMVSVAGDLWTNRFFPGPKLFQGIRAIANDADWSAGAGLDVIGPIEALVLTLAGRFAAVDQLQGEGSAALRNRADALRGQ